MHIQGSSHPLYQGLACHAHNRHIRPFLTRACTASMIITITTWDEEC